jgi:hypothetical protein
LGCPVETNFFWVDAGFDYYISPSGEGIFNQSPGLAGFWIKQGCIFVNILSGSVNNLSDLSRNRLCGCCFSPAIPV